MTGLAEALAGTYRLEPLVASPFTEEFVGASPDGRWISFISDQSGRDEVYVRDLAGKGALPVTGRNGSSPSWTS